MTIDNAILVAKGGYFSERCQGTFALTDEQIERLLQQKLPSPQYVSKKRIEPCRLIKKWNVMMPISVTERSWEEPEV